MSIQGRESLEHGYRYTVRVHVLDATIADDDLLGTLATVALPTPQGPTYINGFIEEVQQPTPERASPPEGAPQMRELTLVPWTTLLSKTADCAVFQEHDVPSVLRKTWQGKPTASYRMKLRRTYPEVPFFVQYRETDLNFLSRLTEHVGLVSFFEHGPQGHVLVLVDSAEDYLSARHPLELTPKTFEEVHASSKVLATRYSVRMNRTEPSAETMEAKGTVSRRHAQGALEIYDYEGTARTNEDVEFFAQLRVEEAQAAARRVIGTVRGRALRVGSVVRLADFAAGMNGEYLVTDANFQAEVESRDVTMSAEIAALPLSTTYRPERKTACPIINGAQIARVVGSHPQDPSRVQVRFAWAQGDLESSSVWLHVARAALGANGAPPAVGEQVILEFLEGDPDRAVVVGILPK